MYESKYLDPLKQQYGNLGNEINNLIKKSEYHASNTITGLYDAIFRDLKTKDLPRGTQRIERDGRVITFYCEGSWIFRKVISDKEIVAVVEESIMDLGLVDAINISHISDNTRDYGYKVLFMNSFGKYSENLSREYIDKSNILELKDKQAFIAAAAEDVRKRLTDWQIQCMEAHVMMCAPAVNSFTLTSQITLLEKGKSL